MTSAAYVTKIGVFVRDARISLTLSRVLASNDIEFSGEEEGARATDDESAATRC
jgi:hypothetical protein